MFLTRSYLQVSKFLDLSSKELDQNGDPCTTYNSRDLAHRQCGAEAGGLAEKCLRISGYDRKGLTCSKKCSAG